MTITRSPESGAAQACRRGTERYRLLYANEAFVEFVGPDRRPWRLELMGLSADGLSFGLQEGKPSLAPGSTIRPVVVHIGSVKVDGALTIAHATEEFAAGTICGARFQPRTDEDAHQLEQAIAELGW
jgi:hypothetical protein